MNVTKTKATGPGALDGFSATCYCGLELRNSLETGLTADIARHQDWHSERVADRVAGFRANRADGRSMFAADQGGPEYDEAQDYWTGR